jgi:hypothetical protein
MGWGVVELADDIIAVAERVPVVGVVAYLAIAACDLREAAESRWEGRPCAAAVVNKVAYVVLGVKLLL